MPRASAGDSCSRLTVADLHEKTAKLHLLEVKSTLEGVIGGQCSLTVNYDKRDQNNEVWFKFILASFCCCCFVSCEGFQE